MARSRDTIVTSSSRCERGSQGGEGASCDRVFQERQSCPWRHDRDTVSYHHVSMDEGSLACPDNDGTQKQPRRGGCGGAGQGLCCAPMGLGRERPKLRALCRTRSRSACG